MIWFSDKDMNLLAPMYSYDAYAGARGDYPGLVEEVIPSQPEQTEQADESPQIDLSKISADDGEQFVSDTSEQAELQRAKAGLEYSVDTVSQAPQVTPETTVATQEYTAPELDQPPQTPAENALPEDPIPAEASQAETEPANPPQQRIPANIQPAELQEESPPARAPIPLVRNSSPPNPTEFPSSEPPQPESNAADEPAEPPSNPTASRTADLTQTATQPFSYEEWLKDDPKETEASAPESPQATQPASSGTLPQHDAPQSPPGGFNWTVTTDGIKRPSNPERALDAKPGGLNAKQPDKPLNRTQEGVSRRRAALLALNGMPQDEPGLDTVSTPSPYAATTPSEPATIPNIFGRGSPVIPPVSVPEGITGGMHAPEFAGDVNPGGVGDGRMAAQPSSGSPAGEPMIAATTEGAAFTEALVDVMSQVAEILVNATSRIRDIEDVLERSV